MSKAESDTESEVIVDPTATLNGLQHKADIMLEMINMGMVEQPPIGRTRWLVRFWFSNQITDGGIAGFDNLRNGLTRAETEGKRIIFTPTHGSDADHPVAVYLMKRGGLKVQDEMRWMAGVNMQRRPSLKRFMRSEGTIYNVTPRDMAHLQTLMVKKDEYEFSAEQIEILEGIKRTFNQMNFMAMKRVIESCVRGRRPLAVYIEGGRSYDGLLRQPQREFSSLFPKNDSAVIIPYRVYGARELNPPGTNPRILRKELLPGCKQEVSMVVGEDYSSAEIWDIYSEMGDTFNPMDWVMANIASLDSRFVKPAELNYYSDLMERFAPERNRMRMQEDLTV